MPAENSARISPQEPTLNLADAVVIFDRSVKRPLQSSRGCFLLLTFAYLLAEFVYVTIV
jgi:hypothetical protein